MENSFEKLLQLYDYNLPTALIAQKPAHPRDSARLLVCSKTSNQIKFDHFYNLGKYLPKNSVLVFNQTKVVPARLMVKKQTGGKAEILYIDHDKNTIKVIADRKLTAGSRLFLTPKIFFEIKSQKENFYFLKPSFSLSQTSAILKKYGRTPLPPYIKNSPLNEAQRRKEYQSVFAKNGLSVAAPTASLHFTKKLIQKLKKQGIETNFVTLNVNLGTFAPLREENLKSGMLHLESYEINKKTAENLNKAKAQGKKIIAVGTTVVRTLEAATKNHRLHPIKGETQLFIQPGFGFKFVDGIITNFHVPQSSLLMLVAAFMGRQKLKNAYKKAISAHFRFFSFGDGMVILP